MKLRILSIAPALALAGVLGACAMATPSNPSADPVATACAEVAKVKASPEGPVLDKLNPHSSAGVLWADAKSACAAGTKKSGVNSAWLLGVVALLAKAAPIVASAL